MKVKKFILLMIIFSIILLLSGSYITLDWVHLIFIHSKYSFPTLKYSEITKLSVPSYVLV